MADQNKNPQNTFEIPSFEKSDEDQDQTSEQEPEESDHEKQAKLSDKITKTSNQIQKDLEYLEKSGNKSAVILADKLGTIKDDLDKLQDNVYEKTIEETEQELNEIIKYSEEIKANSNELRYQKASEYLDAAHDPRGIKQAISPYNKNNVIGQLEGEWFIHYFKEDGKTIDFDKQQSGDVLGALPQYNPDNTPKTYKITDPAPSGAVHFLRFLPYKGGDKTAGGKFYWIGESPLISKPKPLHGSKISEVEPEDQDEVQKEEKKSSAPIPEKEQKTREEEITEVMDILLEEKSITISGKETTETREEHIKILSAIIVDEIKAEKPADKPIKKESALKKVGEIEQKEQKPESIGIKEEIKEEQKISQTEKPEDKKEKDPAKKKPIIATLQAESVKLQQFLPQQQADKEKPSSAEKIPAPEIPPSPQEPILSKKLETSEKSPESGIISKLVNLVSNYLANRAKQQAVKAEEQPKISKTEEPAPKIDKNTAQKALETLIEICDQVSQTISQQTLLQEEPTQRGISSAELGEETEQETAEDESTDIFAQFQQNLKQTKQLYFAIEPEL